MILNRHCVLLVTQKTGTKKRNAPVPIMPAAVSHCKQGFLHLVIHVNLFLFLKTKPVVLK